jgi:uncharacterized membrane protein (UPF0136 family)
MKNQFIRIEYADHTYTATVSRAGQLLGYLKRDSRKFKISGTSGGAVLDSDEWRAIRELPNRIKN